MALVVKAQLSKNNLQAFQKRAEERRQVLETARTMKIQRIQQDVERIVKREREYTKKLVEEIVPVKIVWNEDAWSKLKDFLPFRVEVNTKEDGEAASPAKTVEPEVIVEEKPSSTTA